MISRHENPLGWSLFLYELADAHEHLGELLREAQESLDFDEPELRIALGHVYAHLNRAWTRRNVAEDFPDSQWEMASRFPGDLEPIG